MLAVRYGNVLSSRGSVIPLFKDQIARGGPVTITLPEMTRFLLSLDSAVDTIFAAYRAGRRGEIFVPKVQAARIPDVAEAMIAGRPIETVVTGIRPGEKVHEILVSEEEAHRTTERAGHYVVQPALPELRDKEEAAVLAGEYCSADAVVTGDALAALIAQADWVDPAMGDTGAANGRAGDAVAGDRRP
jgi:UDP-glucose 4-epimerase